MATENKFGNFFRSRRKVLSPVLREFCRKNGFDPANISRLERGLVPPPQARQLLETYAKALKLEEGTVEWNRFFELAAAETGRIPADVMEAEQLLPGLFLQLRAEALGQSNWVKARHLEEWAGTLDARGTLPELLRRLVTSPGKQIRHVSFDAQEQTHRPGWDGTVEAETGDEFVPEGISVWEMGVDKNYRKKFEEDLKKRTKSPLGFDTAKTTFVFVTPRKWQKKAQALKENTDVPAWKKVRIYDSSTLEQWLEQSTAVDVWLAERLGLRPEGVNSFDDCWANLQALTTPSLNPSVFLASRENQVKELERWMDGPAGAMAIETRSPTEAVDFVAAFSRDPTRSDRFGSRALLVEKRDAWRRLAASRPGGLLLMPHPTLPIEPELVAEAVRKGNWVLVPSGQAQREHVEALRLARIYRHDLETALVTSGLEQQKAHTLGREAGGSTTVLKRLLARYPGSDKPEWSKPQEALPLVPLLLAGSWIETSDGDCKAVERIADRPYKAVAELAARWLEAPDSPIRCIGSRWSLVSRDDSWYFLASFLQPDNLRRFEEVALEVLAEDDPTLELPFSKRWEASFRKKGPKYSPALRNGLAETLALLGSRPEALPSAANAENRAKQLVQKLLNGQEWLRWASLSYQLPLLAEAGPEPFLDAIERDLKHPKAAVWKLFEETEDALFGGMAHTGLLWALEVLSWNPGLLVRVCLILGELDAKKLPPQVGNTPFKSLSEIFMPWFPQTTAPVEERVAILQMLMKKRPTVGWRLLLGLLPSPSAIASAIHRPSWREWALTWSQRVSHADYWRQVEATAALLVEGMGDKEERWKTLIKLVENLPRPAYRRLLELLSEQADKVTEEQVRRDVCDVIHEKISMYRRYATAHWALPEVLIAELEKVQQRFEPQDTVQKNAWLFGPHWQALERLNDNEAQLKGDRRIAVDAILAQEGWQGILRLGETVTAPGEVGATVAALALDGCDGRVLPGLLVPPEKNVAAFARGYAWGRLQREGWGWIERLDIGRWSTEEAGQFLRILDFERKTWEFVDQLGPEIAAWYWQHAGGFSRGTVPEETEYVIQRFLEQKRATAAFTQIRMALDNKQVIRPELLLNLMESWLDFEMLTWNQQTDYSLKYDIDLFFQELQKAALQPEPGFEIKRLADLEWRCLALLDGYPSSPVILHRILRDEPEFFAKLLQLCFRPKDTPPKSEAEVPQHERRAAQNAFRLLMSWDTVPGSRNDGTVDEARLLAWTKEARALSEPAGLLEICESRIGQVLAYSPPETDGSWPCIPVRDALEEIGTKEIFKGFQNGIFNKRGTVMRSPREGGAQERKLAELYRTHADASKVEWPHTATALREMASQYEEYAKREDLAAEVD